MEKIFLSDAGPKVSKAIYGFWRWDEFGSSVNAGRMENIVNLCLELGINTFDHADHYGQYQCEQWFGEALAKKSFKREEVVLCSKCGDMIPSVHRPDVRIRHRNTSAKHILASAEQSLRLLQTDYLDIFLLEQPDPLSNLEESALALEQLKSSGKVKHIGVANFTVSQLQLLSSLLRVPIVTNHIALNVLQTEAIDNGVLDSIRQRYMRPLAAAPLAGGRIETGTDAGAVEMRALLQSIGEKYGTNIESTAVAWVVKLGALPLIGTISEQRIRNIAAAVPIDLDPQDWFAIYELGKRLSGQ